MIDMAQADPNKNTGGVWYGKVVRIVDAAPDAAPDEWTCLPIRSSGTYRMLLSEPEMVFGDMLATIPKKSIGLMLSDAMPDEFFCHQDSDGSISTWIAGKAYVNEWGFVQGFGDWPIAGTR